MLCKLDKVVAMGINMLRDQNHMYLTVAQTANLANAYRDATSQPAFQYPDYTFEVYSGDKDGWKLSRFPNKAGLLTRIQHSVVLENARQRDMKRQMEEMCRKSNELFMACVDDKRDPMSDPEFLKAIEEYRQFCNNNGLNK